ncbi:hypothetical protein SCOR_25020 [Sulfidibacter corallicola]|uniref:Uncharacterized protein n=1 Tax=Sulfidibacter corallicola TaxID=2818388 RepID=A0A8A4TTG1_SULCO|nr:hypothetical protein [Sulfidibacter corallicola]QTD52332.1 hypothetical protein J3U87_07640 [Sulfidibacter corallicola]
MKVTRISWILMWCVSSWGWSQQVADETRLVFPWVSHNNQFSSVVFVTNLGLSEVTITLTAYRGQNASDSVREATTTRTIPARGFLEEEANALFPQLGIGSGFTILLEAAASDIEGGWVTYNLTTVTGKSPSQGRAIPIHELTDSRQVGTGREMLFPYLPVLEGSISAPAIVNVGDTAVDVTLHLFTREGTQLPSVTVQNLEPLRPHAVLANDLAGGQPTSNLQIIAEGPQGSFLTGVSFVFNAIGEPSIGNAYATGVTDDSQALFFPWVSRNDLFETVVFINNLGDSEMEINLSARRENGQSTTQTRRVPAGGFLEEKASSLFDALGAGSGFSVFVEASDPSRLFGGWVTNNLATDSKSSPSQGNAVRLPGSGGSDDVGTQLVYNFLPVKDGFTSGPVVANVGDAAADISLFFFDGSGNRVGSQVLSAVQPMLPFARVVGDLVTSGENLYMVAQSDQPLAGTSFVFNDRQEPSMGNAVATLLPVSPEFEVAGEMTVDGSGGQISAGDLTLTVPAAAFAESNRVAILSGDSASTHELATGPGYFLSGLPVDFNQPLTVSIDMADLDGSASAGIGFSDESFLTTQGATQKTWTLLDTQRSGNILTATLPAPPALKTSKRRDGGLNISGEIRVLLYAEHLSDEGHFHITYPRLGTSESDVRNLGEALETAYSRIQALGFDYGARTVWPVRVTVRRLDDSVFGYYSSSVFGDNYGYLEFNSIHLAETEEINVTAGHEFFHLVEALYDPRNRYSKAKFESTHYWLSEASASWIEERFTDTPNWVPGTFGGNGEAPFRGMHAGIGNGSRNHGYGMASLYKHLVDTQGDAVSLNIFTKIRDEAHPVKAVVDTAGEVAGLPWWTNFFQRYMQGEIYGLESAFFLGLRSGLFQIQDPDDETVFNFGLADLAAAMYLIRLDDPDMPEKRKAVFDISGGDSQVMVFQFNQQSGTIQHVSGPSTSASVGNLKGLTEGGWHLMAVALNPRHLSPYTAVTQVSLSVKVELEENLFTANLSFPSEGLSYGYEGNFIAGGLGSLNDVPGFPSVVTSDAEMITQGSLLDDILITIALNKGLTAPGTYSFALIPFEDGDALLFMSDPRIKDGITDFPVTFSSTGGTVNLEAYGANEGDTLSGTFNASLLGARLFLNEEGDTEAEEITGTIDGRFEAEILPTTIGKRTLLRITDICAISLPSAE